MTRTLIFIAALLGCTGVAMAAYATHGLPGRIDDVALAQVHTAVQIQMWHTLAIVAAVLWSARGGVLAQGAATLFTLGTLLFCGAVYLLALADIHIPRMAPAGGFVLMAGWLSLAASSLKPS